MTLPFVLKFYSTAPVCAGRLISVAEATTHLFGGVPLAGEYALDTTEAVIGFDDIEKISRDLPDWTGCLTVVFGDGRGFSGRADLLRLRRKRVRGTQMGELAQYRTHEFMIEIESTRRRELSQYELFEYFAKVSELLEVQFGLAHDSNGVPWSMPSSRGLEGGLPGIYRMTALGAPFVKLIGLDALLRLPVPEVRCLSDGIVAIRLEDENAFIQEGDKSELCDAVKEAIGKEFFAKSSETSFELGGGAGKSLVFHWCSSTH